MERLTAKAKWRIIRIVNPHPRGAGFMHRSTAERMIHAGVARWADPEHTSIRFTAEADYRRHLQAELDTHAVYDRDRRALTLKEIAAIPVVAPMELLIDRSKRRRITPGGRSGPVRRLTPA